MDRSSEDPVVVIVGPTASGKSELAMAVAEAVDAEIVNADSMQIYKGMDIGTAKVPPQERRVVHHGIDLVNPGEPYSAALFQTYARSAFNAISDQGKRAVLSGGTGFYIRAAIDDYDFPKGEQVQNPLREQYMSMAQQQGKQAVWDELHRLDPQSAALLHPNNLVRVVRALEMLEAGVRYCDQVRNLSTIPQALPAIFMGIKTDREKLCDRINNRVDLMREKGLVGEVEGLLNAGFRDAVTAKQAIGYKEIVCALDGECSFDEAYESIKLATRRYAKRQRTWFNADSRIHWLDGNESASDMAYKAIEYLRSKGY